MDKYKDIFYRLWEHSENEIVEFKKAENNFDIDELGKYFSALSNEANIRDRECGWIVFGVWDKKHQIVGTTFKDSEIALNKLKNDMSQHTSDNLIFREIVSIEIDGKRVLMFQVPASPRNIVMRWKGVAYGRDGESLKPLNQAKQDVIRQQPPVPDWTAQLVPNATIDDLDDGFKLSDVFDALHKSLPVSISNDSKKRFLGRLLAKMAQKKLIIVNGRIWKITEFGLIQFGL